MSKFSVLSAKLGHDGGYALLQDNELVFAIEAEKDNGLRYSDITPETTSKALSLCNEIPQVIATSGWSLHSPTGPAVAAGYKGLDNIQVGETKIFGETVKTFSSSHERSHILCAYGLSPFPQGQECYALIWEGHIGSFYFVDENMIITKLGDILADPGIRYAFLYALADPTFKMHRGAIRLSDAGKLMALTGFAQNEAVPEEAKELSRMILNAGYSAQDLYKEDFAESQYYNIGVDSKEFAILAKYHSEQIYKTFENEIKKMTQLKCPLLVVGGCGLNCDWNSRWMESGLFTDVFIPPCANDSGSAIGTAVDAMLYFTGNAKINWNVYSGEMPENDLDDIAGYKRFDYDSHHVAEKLSEGAVLGWMVGRYEMGPRALGARSIIASPCNKNMHDRLNAIKRREGFRPIAPVCLEEDAANYFYPSAPSSYMLEFREVIGDKIPAVRHVDASARPQTINASQNARFYDLLCAFRDKTSVSVLCNTSLNFNGYGFMNKLSDLHRYAQEQGLDGFVFENSFYYKTEA